MQPVGASAAVQAATRGGLVTGYAPDGRPQFLWAASARPALPGQDAAQAARFHLAHFAPAFSLDADTVARASLVRVHDLGKRGAIAHFHQQVDGIDVYRGDAKVLMKASNELVAISGSLMPGDILHTAAHANFKLAPAEGLVTALNDIFGTALAAGDAAETAAVENEANATRFTLHSAELHLSDAARVKKMFVREGNRLTPSYAVEFFAGLPTSLDADAWRVIVLAEDGHVIDRRDLTQHDAFNYRCGPKRAAVRSTVRRPISRRTRRACPTDRRRHSSRPR